MRVEFSKESKTVRHSTTSMGFGFLTLLGPFENSSLNEQTLMCLVAACLCHEIKMILFFALMQRFAFITDSRLP